MLLSVLTLGNLRALERRGHPSQDTFYTTFHAPSLHVNFHSHAEKWGAGKKFRMSQTEVPEGNSRQCRRKVIKVISIPALCCLFTLDKE